MALVIETTHPAGFTAPNAYWRIEEMRMSFANETDAPNVATVLRAYVSATERAAGKPSFTETTVSIPLDEMLALSTGSEYSDFRAAAYAWTKANVSAFLTATDA